MPSLLKSIALVAGAGIALGVYTTARTPRRAPETQDGPDPLLFEPLLDRLEELESQLTKVEANGAAAAQVQSLRQRIVAQEADIQTLRVKLDETERRAAAAEDSVETRLRQFRQEIPAERLGALERVMADQLTSIDGLRERAVESDANLQRLVAVVERLCERPPQPSSTVLPFEAQLAEAAERDPGESRVRVIKESEPDRRHRFPLGRTFAFLLALLLPGLRR
jgi:hypothetical protein